MQMLQFWSINKRSLKMSLKTHFESDTDSERWKIKQERKDWRDFEKNLKKVINSPNSSTISNIGMIVL